MKIEERCIGRVTILDLAGKVVANEGDTLLKDKIRSLVFQGKGQIVINLADVTFMDSSGLGTMCGAFTTARSAGGDIRLLNLTKRIQNLLAITKLSMVFETFDSEEAAVNSYSVTATV